jgi:hypothetical protein
MPRATRVELEVENAELFDCLEKIRDEISDVIDESPRATEEEDGDGDD